MTQQMLQVSSRAADAATTTYCTCFDGQKLYQNHREEFMQKTVCQLLDAAKFLAENRLFRQPGMSIAGKVAPSSSAYHGLIAALPSLHAAALKLLQIWLRAGRTALTPFFASAARLMCDLLSRISAQNLSAHLSRQIQQEVSYFNPAHDMSSSLAAVQFLQC